MSRRNSRRPASFLAVFLGLSLLLGTGVRAAVPYSGYEYSTDNYNSMVGGEETANARPAPSAFVYSHSLNGGALGLDTPLNAPEDFICDDKGNAYILDSLNNRIVAVDLQARRATYVLTGYRVGGGEDTSFTAGRGLYLRENRLYACLPDTQKIVAVDLPAFVTGRTEPVAGEGVAIVKNEPGKPVEIQLEAALEIGSPDLSAFKSNFAFKPTRMVADDAGRLYVVVSGVYDGLLLLDETGAFIGFTGANRIKIGPLDLLWRSLSTDKQIEAQKDTVPIEFNSLDIDDEGFVYTTAKGSESENLVRRLNLMGSDVIKQGAYYIKGDLSPLNDKGTPGSSSDLIDIDATENGIYTCLDNMRGHVFTYNGEGDLLFAFGGLSAQRGAFKVPAAVQWHDGDILVLDKGDNALITFRPTSYGAAIMEAAGAQYSGGYGESFALWNSVIDMNPFNQTAQRNVGKLEYDNGNYEQAMKHFRLGNSPELYSKSFGKQREIAARQVIPWVVGGIIVLLVAAAVFAGVRALRRAGGRWRFFRQQAAAYRQRRRKASGGKE